MIRIKVIGSSSKGNCYHITDGFSPLLLEAGIRFRDVQRALDFKTSNLRGCLITHEHGDHSKYVKDILKNGIDCYMSKGTAEALNLQHHRVRYVSSKKLFQIGTWTIMPFDVQHDVSEPVGFLLMNQVGDKLLFATDTYYIKYKFPNLTHIMVECNYSKKILDDNVASGYVPRFLEERIIKSHFSLENVKEFFLANDLSQAKEIWLLHLSDTNSDADLFKKEVAQITGKMVFIA